MGRTGPLACLSPFAVDILEGGWRGVACERRKKRKGWQNISQKPCAHTVKGQTNKR